MRSDNGFTLSKNRTKVLKNLLRACFSDKMAGNGMKKYFRYFERRKGGDRPVSPQTAPLPPHFAAAALPLVFALFLSFPSGASIVAADPCYSPLELAALFSQSSKPSLKDQIKKIGKEIERREGLIERLESGDESDRKSIEDYKDDLANSLGNQALGNPPDAPKEAFFPPTTPNGKKQPDKQAKAAKVLADYIRDQKDRWDCSDHGDGESDNCTPPTSGTDNTWGSDCPCRSWQIDSEHFQSNGKVKENQFCKDYADERSVCESALRNLEDKYRMVRRHQDKIKNLIKERDRLYAEEDERDASGESEEEGGSTLCLHCLEEIRDLNKPGFGEIAGNVLTAGAGVALSILGVRAGRRAQSRANDLLIAQGYPAENNFGASLAGASLGIPFIYKGLHGLTSANAAGGGVGCAPTANPYASAHPMMQYQMQQQYQAQAMAAAAGNPWGAFNPGAQFGMNTWNAFNPAAQFSLNAGANPWGAFNPGAQFGMNTWNAFNPAAQFSMNAGNPWGAFNPGAQFSLNAGANPWGAFNPGAQFNANFGANPWGAFGPGANFGANFGANPSMNMAYMNQRAQHAMSQMQMRMQMQQAYMAQQMAVQQDWMERQKLIGSLTQEMFKIKSQIDMIASGGSSSGLSFSGGLSGSFSGSLSGGLPTIGGSQPGAPQPSPASTSPGSAGAPTIIRR